MPVLYPAGLTDEIQILIGGFVFAVNVAVYTVVVRRWKRRRGAAAGDDASTPAAVAGSAMQ